MATMPSPVAANASPRLSIAFASIDIRVGGSSCLGFEAGLGPHPAHVACKGADRIFTFKPPTTLPFMIRSHCKNHRTSETSES